MNEIGGEKVIAPNYQKPVFLGSGSGSLKVVTAPNKTQEEWIVISLASSFLPEDILGHLSDLKSAINAWANEASSRDSCLGTATNFIERAACQSVFAAQAMATGAKLVALTGISFAYRTVTDILSEVAVARFTTQQAGATESFLNTNRTITIAASRPKPLQPLKLTAARNASGAVVLNWTAPTDTSGLPITGYSVQLTSPDAPGVVIPESTGSTATTYTDTICPVPDTCNYQVQAITAATNGPFSNSASVSPVPVPSQPLKLTAARNTSGAVVLNWTAPTDTSGLPITGYSVQLTSPDAPGVVIPESTGSTATTYTDTICPVPDTCNYQVQAITAATNGPFSNDASVSPVPVPSQPLKLTAARNTSGAVVLNWTAPTDTSGLPITGYSVQLTSPDAPGVVIPESTGSTTTTYTDTICPVSDTCNYQVQAITAAGNGPSATARSVSPVPVPSQPLRAGPRLAIPVAPSSSIGPRRPIRAVCPSPATRSSSLRQMLPVG